MYNYIYINLMITIYSNYEIFIIFFLIRKKSIDEKIYIMI